MNFYLLYDGGIVDNTGAKQKWLHFPRAHEIQVRCQDQVFNLIVAQGCQQY
jgi:hypothetical protein